MLVSQLKVMGNDASQKCGISDILKNIENKVDV